MFVIEHRKSRNFNLEFIRDDRSIESSRRKIIINFTSNSMKSFHEIMLHVLTLSKENDSRPKASLAWKLPEKALILTGNNTFSHQSITKGFCHYTLIQCTKTILCCCYNTNNRLPAFCSQNNCLYYFRYAVVELATENIWKSRTGMTAR